MILKWLLWMPITPALKVKLVRRVAEMDFFVRKARCPEYPKWCLHLKVVLCELLHSTISCRVGQSIKVLVIYRYNIVLPCCHFWLSWKVWFYVMISGCLASCLWQKDNLKSLKLWRTVNSIELYPFQWHSLSFQGHSNVLRYDSAKCSKRQKVVAKSSKLNIMSSQQITVVVFGHFLLTLLSTV